MDNLHYLYIFLGTCFFSFGVQTLFYIWYLARNEPIIDKYKTVFSYWSGFVGDAVLIPVTNVFAILALNDLGNPYLDFTVWIPSIFVGLGVTFTMHWGQKHYNLTNWTMPQKGKWTLLGIYHSLFMFCESIFLSFALISFLKRVLLSGQSSLAGSHITLGLGLMFIFFTTFVYDYWQPLFKRFFSSKVKYT